MPVGPVNVLEFLAETLERAQQEGAVHAAVVLADKNGKILSYTDNVNDFSKRVALLESAKFLVLHRDLEENEDEQA